MENWQMSLYTKCIYCKMNVYEDYINDQVIIQDSEDRNLSIY